MPMRSNVFFEGTETLNKGFTCEKCDSCLLRQMIPNMPLIIRFALAGANGVNKL